MANLALRFRTSKFRHVYGAAVRKEHCFENIRITRNTHDSNFCSVNPSFIAVVLESSGCGSFAILDVNRPGRVDVNCPKVSGHAGAVLDVKWSPFNDQLIASAAEDGTVKLWTIPENGLSGTLTEWSADLHGHSRKVSYLEWHPTADSILMSVGFDKKIMVWNVEQAEPVMSLLTHPDTVYSVAWGRNGSVVASTCKDKKIRIMDARTSTVVTEMEGHGSTKASKCVYIGDHFVFTTGFSRSSDRQYGLWDVRKAGRPVVLNELDCSSGIILPYFDPDINLVYMAGKGDGMIRYVEVLTDPSDVFFLNLYQSPLPQRGLGMMPKRGVDTSKNEITRFYKLHASKNLVEPIPMIAPRKAEGYQRDIYPPTSSNFPSLTADEWSSGLNRGPILLELEDGSILDKPRSYMSSAVQPQIGSLSKAPEITTYKAVTKATPTSPMHRVPQGGFNKAPPTALRTSPDGVQSSPTTNETVDQVNGRDKSDYVPSSIKNIRRLSMNFESRDSVPNHQYSTSPSPSSPTPLSPSQSLSSIQSNNRYSHSPSPSPSPSPSSPSYNQPVRSVSYTVLNGVRNESPSHHQTMVPSCDVDDVDGGAAAAVGPISTAVATTTTATSTSSVVNQTIPQPPLPPSSSSSSLTLEEAAAPPFSSSSSSSPPPPPPPSSGHVSAVTLVLGQHGPPITSSSTPANAIHVRKVWTPPASPSTVVPIPTSGGPATDSELKKAYFRQLEEIRSLHDQVTLKDKRINELETELSKALAEGAELKAKLSESDC